MAWRCNLNEMTSFTATLIAADSVGASIGPILKSLSIEIREKKQHKQKNQQQQQQQKF